MPLLRHGKKLSLKKLQKCFIDNKKLRQKLPELCGGLERGRTAVQGFADLCLTTRPRDHYFEFAKLLFFFNIKFAIAFKSL